MCRERDTLFIMDEGMTGFRIAPGGAQALWNLDPDITTLGKVIGGGLPVGAYAGKQEIMETVAPAGPIYQAGTLSGNPLAMTAGLATIRGLLKPGVFDDIARKTAQLVAGIEEAAGAAGFPVQTNHVGTMFGMYFLKEADAAIIDYATAKEHADTDVFSRFFHAMLAQGVYLAPSQFEAGFVSSAHSDDDIAHTIEAATMAMQKLGGDS